ncbi:MAG: transcriptional repressor [Acidimicrobiia bacterium]|nr:transcriptional repressor [Acidimicrobiia bacterium]MDH5520419.1 transcriptional repressor [Acidimicrobiia bacterium]
MGAPTSPSSRSAPGRRQAEADDDTMVDLHAAVARRLERHDHRYTPGRRHLVETLARVARPVTLPQISSHSDELPQSSAYRNLEVLERCGVISRIAGSADHAHFELAEPLVDHHHHLVCVSCGSLQDVHLDDELEALVDAELAQAAAAAGFTPTNHSLDLHGYCHNCEPDR